MMRVSLLLASVVTILAGCVDTSAPPALGPDGQPLPRAYRINTNDTSRIQFGMVDSVNALRAAAGQPQVELDSRLNAAAATHSRDMAQQNRPWHFGSDGSSPIDRVRRAGYTGQMLGEAISETYETETATLGAWMQEPGTRSVVLDPQARDLGFAWFQEDNGKIWWTMLMGGPGAGFAPSGPTPLGASARPGGSVEDVASAALQGL